VSLDGIDRRRPAATANHAIDASGGRNSERADNMAGPFDAAVISSPSIWRRTPFGVGHKLQLAFGIVAGLTAISTVVSLLCFSAVEAGLRDFATRASLISQASTLREPTEFKHIQDPS
jgi:hypothetical protein